MVQMNILSSSMKTVYQYCRSLRWNWITVCPPKEFRQVFLHSIKCLVIKVFTGEVPFWFPEQPVPEKQVSPPILPTRVAIKMNGASTSHLKNRRSRSSAICAPLVLTCKNMLIADCLKCIHRGQPCTGWKCTL